jgi:hypothetical protein
MISSHRALSSSVRCSWTRNTSGRASGKTPLALGALNIRATSEPSSIRPPVGLRRAAAGMVFVVMVFREGEICLFRRRKVICNRF